MKNNLTQADRLQFKTAKSRISNYLKKRYKFSPVISEALTGDTLFFNTVFGNSQCSDGQIIYYGVNNQESAGKPLKDCQYIKLILTLYAKDDAKYREKHGLKELRLKIVKRMCNEAVVQGGCLTHEDIAKILFLDRTTVSAYIKTLEKRGYYVPTRAHYTDQSKRYTHKEQIIKLYLMHFSETEISKRTNHNLEAVENYINEFLRINLLFKEHKPEATICRVISKSPGLVKEYILLYQQLEKDNYYKESLEKKMLLYRIDIQSDLSKFNTSPFKKKILQEVRI